MGQTKKESKYRKEYYEANKKYFAAKTKRYRRRKSKEREDEIESIIDSMMNDKELVRRALRSYAISKQKQLEASRKRSKLCLSSCPTYREDKRIYAMGYNDKKFGKEIRSGYGSNEQYLKGYNATKKTTNEIEKYK